MSQNLLNRLNLLPFLIISSGTFEHRQSGTTRRCAIEKIENIPGE
jgi:hypothetical protein